MPGVLRDAREGCRIGEVPRPVRHVRQQHDRGLGPDDRRESGCRHPGRQVDVDPAHPPASLAGDAVDEVAIGGEVVAVDDDLDPRRVSGVLRIETAEARSEAHDIFLSGLVPYVGGGLALSGRIFPAGADPAATAAQATFFVGGSWSVPFVSPILPVAAPE